MAEWQPIDTAPHDGTTVWVLIEQRYDSAHVTRFVVPAMWSTMDASWCCPYQRKWLSGIFEYSVGRELAWHPLDRPLAPPKDQFTGQE